MEFYDASFIFSNFVLFDLDLVNLKKITSKNI